MSKTIIEVKCYDQVLTFVNTPVVASGGAGEDFVSAEFCEKWDGFVVSMLFWRQGGDPIPVLADADGLFPVPPELMTTDGVVYFGALGVDPNGVRRTSEGTSYRIQAGAITENTSLPEPDGDVFTQLLAQYADVKLYVASRVDEAADAAVHAENAADNARDAVLAVADYVFPNTAKADWVREKREIRVNTGGKSVSGKMLISFVSPCDAAAADGIKLTWSGGVYVDDILYSLADDCGGQLNDQAFFEGDYLQVVLDNETRKAYIMNPRVTERMEEVINDQIYPGIVEGYWHNDSENIGITLDKRPPDKMLLTFRVPYYTSTIKSHSASWLRVSYPGVESNTGYELFSLRNGFSQVPPKQAISPGDVITVLLTRSDNESYGRCYLLNSRITKTALDEMDRRIYPGIPTSKTTNGTMVISLDFEPEEKFFMVFAADEASSAVSKFVLDYESYEEGPVQVEYALWDAKDSPVKSYGFYQGDHVVVVLSPADKRATVLNPRVTRDTMNLIQGVVDMVPSGNGSSGGGVEIVTYTGNGSSSQMLYFSKLPKMVQIESVSTGGYFVSALLFRAENIAKTRVFSDGSYFENVVDLLEMTVWNDNYVMLGFHNYTLKPGEFNVNNTKYIAIGYM